MAGDALEKSISFRLLSQAGRFSRCAHRLPGMRRLIEPLRRIAARWPQEHMINCFDGDQRFLCRLDEHIASHIFWYGSHSGDQLRVLERCLPKEGVFIDVGANLGEFTCFAARRCRRVFAFEPLSVLRGQLRRNVELNRHSNVTLVGAALGDQAGKRPLYVASRRFDDGTRNEGLGTLHPTTVRSLKAETVEVLRLDDYIEEVGERVDGLKIDVEGHELAVLRGAQRVIRRDRPFILIELARETCASAGTTMEEVYDLVSSLGYRAERIGAQGECESLRVEGLGNFQNVLFLPTEADR